MKKKYNKAPSWSSLWWLNGAAFLFDKMVLDSMYFGKEAKKKKSIKKLKG